MTFLFSVLPWPCRGATPSPLDIGDQQGQCTVEDGGDIAIGDGVPQKIPGAAQFVLGVGADRYLQAIVR
jgi:hypothetical protein